MKKQMTENRRIVEGFLKGGAYWFDDLDKEQKAARKAEKKKKPKYILKVVTDVWAGNFERELVAYVFGKLDAVQENIGYAENIIKQFWNEKEGEGIDSYDDYKLTIDAEQDKYAALYEKLQETYQVCDDWEQYTFYNIDFVTREELLRNKLLSVNESDIPSEDKGKISCITIQFCEPMEKEMEDEVISRIKTFFDDNIYGALGCDVSGEKATVLGLYMVDKNGKTFRRFT